MSTRDGIERALAAQQQQISRARLASAESSGRQQIGRWFQYTMPLPVTFVQLTGYSDGERPPEADDDEALQSRVSFLVVAGGIRFTVKYYMRSGMRLWLEGREQERPIRSLQELLGLI